MHPQGSRSETVGMHWAKPELVTGTFIHGGLAQFGRAPAPQAEGRRFEPGILHHVFFSSGPVGAVGRARRPVKSEIGGSNPLRGANFFFTSTSL